MLPDPLHPAVVHFPVALAFATPALAILGAVWIAKGAKPIHGWSPVVLSALLLAAGALVAVQSGEDQEDRIEAIVPEDAFELHEERGELLRNLAILALVVSALGLLDGRKGWVGRGLAGAALVAVAAVAWLTGASGGELVYRHGAGSAYAVPSSGAEAGYVTEARQGHDEHDDD
jgi:uncharacterized membrane protein